MRLLNFKLANSRHPIELEGLEHSWDLHNQGEFLNLIFDPFANKIVMEWFTGQDVRYSALKLLFNHVRRLEISPRDEELPPSEDYCLSYVAKVASRSAKYDESNVNRKSEEEDPFHLFFEFRSGRTIEIDSDTVELVAVFR